ncbi:Sodium/calcium exchanger protein-domain-containing protein [Lyophyllum atratum]|nr:Sodium/calcium exchanger protein-domain-containing protein [Lyophyllum atratum]
MSHNPARFIFALVLAINVLLWSQSRYAVQDASLLRGDNSLVKRISQELLHPDISSISGGFEKECRPLAHPTANQCAHVQNACPASHTFLSINYLKHYFCTSLPLRPLAFTALLVWLIFLFSTLGISASDFFTPNLATIAQLLGLDENVAGVTFLAFGNGSPDVFSTFSAMKANSGSLAIGELLGAASFIVSCVVGSMCVIKPFKVSRGPFLRDVGFFTVAVSLLLVILWDGQIRPWEAGLLIGVYFFYVALVVLGSWWERRQEVKRHTEAMRRAEYEDDEFTVTEPYRDYNGPSGPSDIAISISPPPPEHQVRSISAPARPRIQTNLPRRPHSRNPSPTPPSASSHAQIPSFSLVGALEFRHVVNSLQHQAAGTALNFFESPVTPYAGGHYHAHPASRQRTPRSSLSSRDNDPWDAAMNAVALDDRSRLSLHATPARSPVISEEPSNILDNDSSEYFGLIHSPSTVVPSIIRTSASPTISDGDTESQNYVPPTRRQKAYHVLKQIFHTLFPSLHHFGSQSILGQIAAIFATPAVMLLTLTLPVVVTPYQFSSTSPEKPHHQGDGRLVDFEEEGEARVLIAEEEVLEDMHEMLFNKWLTAAQCILAPLFCVAVLFHGTRHQVALYIGAAIGGFVTAVLVIASADKGDHPTARMARCSMGFLVAIVWIMAIADEVVNVLQTFGFIFGLSDAIIGLTIFAVGNSLADLVANMSVAVFAPIMGFSACFGGPMLNILLGVGVSGTYITQQTSTPYVIHFSTTLFVSTIGLLILLAATLIYVPMNDYFLSRRWGVLLIASYTVLMTVNVIVELKTQKSES